MAHFAQLNKNSVVTQVIVVNNTELTTDSEIEIVDGMVQEKTILSESKGIEFCKSLFGANTNWRQTSYNGSFRGKYAGIGDTYDEVNNVFVSPVVESAIVIEALQTTDIQDLSSVDISALNTSDLQSLTTTGL
jgi:hypothetical protein